MYMVQTTARAEIMQQQERDMMWPQWRLSMAELHHYNEGCFKYVYCIGGNELVAYPLKTRRLARSASASSTLEIYRRSNNERSRINLLRTLCEYVQQMRQFVSWHRLPVGSVPKPRRSRCI